jgi:hypothetical protein
VACSEPLVDHQGIGLVTVVEVAERVLAFWHIV